MSVRQSQRRNETLRQLAQAKHVASSTAEPLAGAVERKLPNLNDSPEQQHMDMCICESMLTVRVKALMCIIKPEFRRLHVEGWRCFRERAAWVGP